MLLVIGAAVLAILLAFVVRIIIFNTMDEDREAAELLSETYPTTNDFLFWHLWRARGRIAKKHRWKVELYFWLKVTAAALLITGLYVEHLSSAAVP